MRRVIDRWVDRRYGPPPGRPCTPETNHCCFSIRGEDYQRPECCSSHLTALAVFTADLCTRHGIAYWLDFGSLLGAARDGHLIPWDSDVDFGILSSDAEKFKGLEGEVTAAGHVLDLSDPCRVRIYSSRTNRLHVDLFKHVEEGPNLRMFFDDWMQWPGVLQHEFPRHFVDASAPISLEGHMFPAPAPVDSFLAEHRFGARWRVPVRPFFSLWRLPRVSPSEAGPPIDRVLGELSRQESRLMYDEARPVGRLGADARWQLWQLAARPAKADPRRVERRRLQLAPGDRRPIMSQLLATLAVLDQAVDEIEAEGARGVLRRNLRRPANWARYAGSRARRLVIVPGRRVVRRAVTRRT